MARDGGRQGTVKELYSRGWRWGVRTGLEKRGVGEWWRKESGEKEAINRRKKEEKNLLLVNECGGSM